MGDSGVNMRSDVAGVLAQMRQIREATQMDLGVDTSERLDVRRTDGPESFGALLKSSIDAVNDVQGKASQDAAAFVRGEHDDLVRVMVSAQKSSVAFQALTQVRNRVVSAYQDIMNMPI